VGKGHLGPRGSPGADPANLGFDVNVGGAAFGHPGSYYGRKDFGNKGPNAAWAVPHLEKYHGTDVFLTEALTLEANARVSEAVGLGKPFFLYFAHYAVHAPFEPDPRFAAHYTNSGKPKDAQAFATLIEGMDKSLGDVVDHLDRLGVARDTLVVFLGDNGSDAPLGGAHEVACAAPLRGKKGSHYEGGMRVPFLTAWARLDPANPRQQQLPIPAGALQTQQASVPDLFPTLLDVAGVRPPADHVVDGRTLATLLRGRSDPGRKETFLMHYPHAPHRSDYWTSWREGAWKVVYHYFPAPTSGHGPYQLFNLREDPFEQADLAAVRPDELRRMMEGLIGALESHGALYPVDPMTRQALKPRLP
jgi:arylsulfatase A-like enzyme